MFIYILSGAMIGLAWAALFFGYKNTNVSLAIVIYNMCPVYVMILSPLILKERLSKLQVTIIGISFTGLIFVIGVINLDYQHLSGILFSGASGILYATIVIMKRRFNSKMDHSIAN
jgi:drug/metabolite transporter (DMT)-like permease